MKEMVPMILSGRKIITNRIATPFRQKLEVGGTMHVFTGMRTPNCKRIGTAEVIEKANWKIYQIPHPDNHEGVIYNMSPLKDMNWEQFAWIDGFDTYKYKEFYDYFTTHKKIADELGFVCYKFKFSMER